MTNKKEQTRQPQQNVCLKYGITRKELKDGVEQYSKIATPRAAIPTPVLLAIIDLLTAGDVPAPLEEMCND